MFQIKDAVDWLINDQVGACVSGKEPGGACDDNDCSGRGNFVEFERHLTQGNAPVIQFITICSTCGSAYQRVVVHILIRVELYRRMDSRQGDGCNQQYA